jgi:hypothetical protein
MKSIMTHVIKHYPCTNCDLLCAESDENEGAYPLISVVKHAHDNMWSSAL